NNARDPRRRAERGGELLGNRLRRLPQRARELKRDRDREIAKRASRRHLDGERRDLCHAEPADGGGNLIVDLLLNAENHEWVDGNGGWRRVLRWHSARKRVYGTPRMIAAFANEGTFVTSLKARAFGADKSGCGMHPGLRSILSLVLYA